MDDFPQTEREMIEAAETHMEPPDDPYGGGRPEMVRCPACKGTGDEFHGTPQERECPVCKGEGEVDG